MKILIAVLIILSLYSCKKESLSNNLSNVVFSNKGVLRVECNDCKVSYSVSDKNYNIDIKGGSKDIPFFYVADFNLKTQIKSLEEQGIRLMVMDSFGRIVSNELNSYTEGEVYKGSFMINTK